MYGVGYQCTAFRAEGACIDSDSDEESDDEVGDVEKQR